MRRKTNRNLKEKENLVNGTKEEKIRDQAIKKLIEEVKENASKIGLVVLEREEFITLAQCRYNLIDIAKALKDDIVNKFAILETIKMTLKH